MQQKDLRIQRVRLAFELEEAQPNILITGHMKLIEVHILWNVSLQSFVA